MVIYSMLPLLIITGLLLIKKVEIKKIVNGIFWGIISIIITFFVSEIILTALGIKSIYGLTTGVSIYAFIFSLITATLPEEISKFISIKLTKSKNKINIFINSILIGITFASLENYIYISGYGLNIALTRMLHPGHLFFQLIMAMLLTKSLNYSGAKKTIFNSLAILLPALCHAVFNTLVEIKTMAYIFYIIGIATYIFTFIYILKLSYDDENYNHKFTGLKITIIILALLSLIILYPQNRSKRLNENQIISEENIELKVISSEKIEKNDGFLDGNYIKIQVELKNNNDMVYEVSIFNFEIVDSLNKNGSRLTTVGFDNQLSEVKAKETKIGYLYFKDEGHNYKYLTYLVGGPNNYKKYDFKIN